MTYKEHLIFVATRRDAGGCFWLPLASVCWSEGEIKHLVSLKGRPQDRFVYSTEAERFAAEMAREWVDNRVRNGASHRLREVTIITIVKSLEEAIRPRESPVPLTRLFTAASSAIFF